MAQESERNLLASFRPRPNEPTHPFRLSVARMLLWTGATALALFLLQPTYKPRQEIAVWACGGPIIGSDRPTGFDANAGEFETVNQPREPIGPALVATAAAPFYGAAILALWTAVWMTIAGIGPLDIREPGHWFLLIVGSAFLGITLWTRLPAVTHIALLWGLMLGAGILLVGSSMVLTVWACFADSNPSSWRIIFRLLAGGGVCGCAPITLCGLICLVSAVVLDLNAGRRHDLAHWIGVATVFAVYAHLAALVMVMA